MCRRWLDRTWLAAWFRSSPGAAAVIRRASTLDDLYYPFSSNRSIAPGVCIPWVSALIGHLDELFNKDYQFAHLYNPPGRGAAFLPGRRPP
jgi:hypothetical protein